MSRSRLQCVGLLAVVSVAAACSASGSGNSFGSGGAAAGSGGHAATGTGGGSTTAPGTGGSIFTTTGNGGGNTGSGTACNHDPDTDGDGDGWTTNEGDCNDCDPNVNPGAIEVINSDPNAPKADEDCDGTADNVAPPCDDGIALTDVDPVNGAKTIELCKLTTESPADKKQKTWGVLDAKYVRANGTTFASPGAQVGIMDGFGPNVHVQGGKRMLAISSGHARIPGQPGACGSLSCTNTGVGTAPTGFPQDNPNCPPSKKILDDIGFEVKVRAPTNATGYSFNFKFHSFEYPEWVCNNYNDQFIALVNPAPAGAINGNISFDSNNSAVSVNIAFFDVCDPAGKSNYASFCLANCPSPPNPYCPAGKSQLQGTGFDVWDDAGATSWLKSQAPVTGGSEFSIRFAIWDTGDSNYDSTTLVDNFQWVANGGTVTVSTDPISQPK